MGTALEMFRVYTHLTTAHSFVKTRTRSHLSSMAIRWQTVDTDDIRPNLVGGFLSIGRLYSEGDLELGA
jgi:hypothetical protein